METIIKKEYYNRHKNGIFFFVNQKVNNNQ